MRQAFRRCPTATKEEPGSWLVPSSDGYTWYGAPTITFSDRASQPYRINDVAVVNALEMGAFDTVEASLQDAGEVYMGYPLTDGVNTELRKVAEVLSNIGIENPILVARTLQRRRDEINRYDSFSRGLLFSMGKITFGYVTPTDADEMRFTVPRNIAKDFDLYWLEFNDNLS